MQELKAAMLIQRFFRIVNDEKRKNKMNRLKSPDFHGSFSALNGIDLPGADSDSEDET